MKLCVPGFVSNAPLSQCRFSTVVKMKTYWDAHHKHFPKDALDRLLEDALDRPSDEDDGDETDEYHEV